jgi:hypothetical protein
VQGDASAHWRGGHLSAALGAVQFDDNDTAADNSRDLTYGYVEVVQDLTPDLYAATRYSRIDAPGATALVFRNQRLEITGAKRVDVTVTIASGYVNRYPSYTGRDYPKLNRDTLGTATSKGFDRLLADHADLYYIPIAPHNVASPIGTVAAGHVCAAMKNFLVMEFHAHDVPWWSELVTGGGRIEGGFIHLTNAPGHGLTLNEDVARAHLAPGSSFFGDAP